MRQAPGRWTDSLVGMAVMVLVAALALHVAAKLIVAVLPVLIGIAVLAVAAWTLWGLYRFWQSRW